MLTFSSHFVCGRCLALEAEAQAQKEAEARRVRLDLIERQVTIDQHVDYGAIPFEAAAVVYGVMVASGEACERGKVGSLAGLGLCPSTRLASDLFGELFEQGIVLFDQGTSAEAITRVEGDAFSYYPNKVNWRLAADSKGRTFPQVFSRLGSLLDLHEAYPGYFLALSDFWWKLATDDAEKFLSDEIAGYKIGKYEIGPKTEEAVRYALDRLSIPRVRRIIRSVVKNAAALSMKGTFTRAHALNTINGNIVRYVDRAVSEGWDLYPVLHDWQNQEPVLMTVLLTGFSASA